MEIVMYSTSWCGDCRNAKRFLQEKGVTYTEIDIDQNEEAAEQVISWSGGRRVIPTFYITGGPETGPLIVHNPPLRQLAQYLGISL
jgi:mycoredoxin